MTAAVKRPLMPRRDVMMRLGLRPPAGRVVDQLLTLHHGQTATLVANMRRSPPRRMHNACTGFMHPTVIGRVYIASGFIVDGARWNYKAGKCWLTLVGMSSPDRIVRDAVTRRLLVVPWHHTIGPACLDGIPFRLVADPRA